MSFEAMAWAVKQKVKPMQKLVLLMLANRHNGDSGQCNPSHSKLAEDCNMSISGVKKAIKELSDLGLLRIRTSSKDGVSLPNQYFLNTHLNVDLTQKLVGHEVTGVGHEVTGGGSHGDRGVGHEVTTKQEVETVNETVKRKEAKKPHTSEKTFSEYLKDCEANEVFALPADSEAHRLADKLFIEDEMFDVAWLEFKYRHLDADSASSKKKQKDWVKAFASYMRKGYLKIWYFKDGKTLWTTEGLNMRAAHLNK